MIHYTITPPRRGWDEVKELYSLVQDRGYIAGGFAAYMASPLDEPYPPGDIDIFAKSTALAWDITRDICAARGWLWDVSPIAYTLEPNSLLYIDGAGHDNRRKVQVICPHARIEKMIDRHISGNGLALHKLMNDKGIARGYLGAIEPEMIAILDGFDFDVIRALLINENEILVHPNVGQRQAQLLHITDPMGALRRVMKYQKKGVTFSEGELFKLFEAYRSITGDQHSMMLNRYAADMEYNYTVDFDDRWFELYPHDREGTDLPHMQFERADPDILF